MNRLTYEEAEQVALKLGNDDAEKLENTGYSRNQMPPGQLGHELAPITTHVIIERLNRLFATDFWEHYDHGFENA